MDDEDKTLNNLSKLNFKYNFTHTNRYSRIFTQSHPINHKYYGKKHNRRNENFRADNKNHSKFRYGLE